MNSGKVENYRPNSSLGFPASLSPDSPNVVDKLRNFSHGDTSALDAPGLVDVIAHYIFKLYRSGQLGETLILLEQLGEAAQNGPKIHRERALIVLSMVAEKILEESNEDLLEPIAQMLVRWIKKENEYVAGFEFISLQLSRLIHKMLEQGLWYQVEDLVGVLQDIKKGVIEKNKLIRQIISRAHASIAEDSSLNKLIVSYIDESNHKSEVAGALLTRLSDKSTPYLLQTLAHCDNKEQRFRLLNLIPAAGTDAVPLLLQKLKDDSPWYFTRNILGMLAHFGDPAFFDSTSPFLRHGDVRVQQEAVNCIVAMDGQEKTSRLLEALNICDHRLKPRIIKALGTTTDDRIGSVFIGLLNSITIFEPHLQNQIVQLICEYLPQYSSEKSFSQLEKLVADSRCRENLDERTLAAIERACAAVRRTSDNEALPDWIVGIEPAEPSYGFRHDSSEPAADTSTPKWFSQVVQSEAFLMMKNHLLLHRVFYHQLNRDEFDVYSALLSRKTFDKGDIIASAGDVHSTLYFVDRGEIGLFDNTDTTSAPWYELKEGDLFGYDTFMNGSEWTLTLQAAKEDTELFLFDQEHLLGLQPQYPELCQKILKYSKENDILSTMHAAVVSPLPGESLTVPFTGDIGDHIADALLFKFTSSGLCFCFSLPPGISYEIFAGRELHVALLQASGKSTKVKAQILGLRFFEKHNRSLCILARFTEKIDPTTCCCDIISL